MHKHNNYHLGTFGFPSTGWWVVHAVGIAAIYYWGYKAGQMDCQGEEDF